MNVLEVKSLTKEFQDKKVVDEVSFSLEKGEILGLLGPNGAGKTTTIQMLLGVLTPTSGEVLYFGKDFKKNREEILEQVNFSSTYTNLPWDLTVKECLFYTLFFYDIKDRKKRLEEIKTLFRLEDIFNQRVSELSAGQLTRLNLAKAFLNYPEVLLLDEPTASLDPEVAKYMREFLLEERKNFNISIIITSHNMAEVEDVCDRVVFINEGKIIASDTPKNLARSIKTSHLEIFVGDKIGPIQKYCRSKKINFRNRGNYVVIDIQEEEIAKFLENIKKEGIIYEEISIQKPSLEDYFFEIVSKNNRKFKKRKNEI